MYYIVMPESVEPFLTLISAGKFSYLSEVNITLTFIKSQKGNNLLLHNRYLHIFYNNGKNKYIWRCIEYNKYKCSSCFTSTKDETCNYCKYYKNIIIYEVYLFIYIIYYRHIIKGILSFTCAKRCQNSSRRNFGKNQR